MVVRHRVELLQHVIMPGAKIDACRREDRRLPTRRSRHEGSPLPGAIEMVDRRLQFRDAVPVASTARSSTPGISVEIGVVPVELLQDDR